MRDKMHDHLDADVSETSFDLKHDRGGIVDIEFMVQYQILAHAEAHPELAHTPIIFDSSMDFLSLDVFRLGMQMCLKGPMSVTER